jgi:hypothetical protein
MAKFLVTMLPANDLGLPTRMVPIARALADRGHGARPLLWSYHPLAVNSLFEQNAGPFTGLHRATAP